MHLPCISLLFKNGKPWRGKALWQFALVARCTWRRSVGAAGWQISELEHGGRPRAGARAAPRRRQLIVVASMETDSSGLKERATQRRGATRAR